MTTSAEPTANPSARARQRRQALWRWAFALCASGVLVLSLLPPSADLPTTGWDKSNHLLAFASLAFLAQGAWPGRTALTLTALLAYGGLIEVLQSFTPNREADWHDVVADGVGLAIGQVMAWLRLWWRRRW